MPSTVAQAPASRRSAGVPGASKSGSATSGSPASAVSVFLSILLLAVSGRLCRQQKADGTMYPGSDPASRSRRARASSGRGPV